MAHVELLRPGLDASGLGALEAEWRDLEARADSTFFQGWTWVGCLARERFSHPVLLRATDAGRTVGLGLFNERRRLGMSTLWLGESGDPALDRVFVEHNGLLTEAGRADEVSGWLRTAMCAALPGGFAPSLAKRRLVLGGIGASCLAAANAAGSVCVRTVRAAPFVDLDRLGRDGEGFLDRLGRSTRQQLRRSDRLYGSLQVYRATTPEEADAFLSTLLGLHSSRFAARGLESSLAHPMVKRFVRELVARGVPRGEVDLLLISSGETAVGYLLNLRRGDWIGQYQGGFDYAGAEQHHKPGLSCHHAAIRYYCAQGAVAYDFLAGADRYKRSLADAETGLHWVEAAPHLSLQSVIIKIRGISMTE